MMIKRVFSILLALLILAGCFAGCGKEQTEISVTAAPVAAPSAKGRYVQESIPLPPGEGALDMALLSNGRLAVAMRQADDGARVYTTGMDHVAWEESYALPGEMLIGALETLALAPDGGAFCSVLETLEDGTNQPHFFLLDAAGASREIPVTYGDIDPEAGYFAPGADFTASGRLMVEIYINEVRELDLQTGALGENLNQMSPLARDVRCAGEDVYIVAWDSVSVSRDGETQAVPGALGEQLAASLKATEGNDPKLTFWANDEGYLFFTTHDGLYSIVPDGSVTEELVSGARSSLGDPSFYPIAMTGTEDGSFWVLEREALCRYTYDAQTPTQADTQLRVYSLYEDEDLRQMISQYQIQHGEVTVDLEVGVTADNGVTEADAVRTLNTQILAGDGPDLLVLDGFSLDAYLDKGLLLDLTDVLAAADPLLEQVTNCYASDGAVCAVPTTFALPAMYGEERLVSQIHDLDSLVAVAKQVRAENPDAERIVCAMNPKLMAVEYYDSCSAAWIRPDGTLDAEELTRFYAAMRELYALDEGFRQENMEWVEQMAAEADEELLIMGDYLIVTGAFGILADISYLSAGTLNSLFGWAHTLAGEAQYLGDGYQTIHLDGQASNVFVPRRIVGILNTSAYPEEAKGFLSFMLSDEVQGADLNTGFPVNRITFDRQIAEEGETDYVIDTSDKDGNELTLAYQWPDASRRQELKTWVDTLTTPALTDKIIRSMVLAQMDDCCNGVTTPQQAAQAAVQSLNLYLSE